MRRWMLGALVALLMVGPAQVHAQASEDALAPFIGKYTDTPGGERQNVYITTRGGVILTWYFGGVCGVHPYPCDPPSGTIGNVPGGMATAAIWRIDGSELVGDVLSTTQADWIDTGPIRVLLLSDGKLGLRQNDTVRVFDRVR